MKIAIGQASAIGQRQTNEDFYGIVTPEPPELINKGIVAAVADGVGGHRGGRQAAEYAVRGLLADYYSAPDTYSVPHCIEIIGQALNRWIHAEGKRSFEFSGMATTLSALVLRGQRYYVAHVGDSRIYLLREGQLSRLTEDHLWDHPELNSVLARAMGLDDRILFDFRDETLQAGDRFMMLSDGVHGILSDTSMREILLKNANPQAAAASLTSLALATGGHDNATAMIIDVLECPEIDARDTLEKYETLPVAKLNIGDELDGMKTVEILHQSRETVVYRMQMIDSGKFVVLKTLQSHTHTDKFFAQVLLKEEWLLRRIVSTHFAEYVPQNERSRLYFLASWHRGKTLAQISAEGHKFSVLETIQWAKQLLKAVSILHRLRIIHRDIKPENIHIGDDGMLRLLDLGVALSETDINSNETAAPAGTPSYMAPELFHDAAPHYVQDLYAVGVTLYFMLTRKYPYGEIEPFQQPKFGDPIRPTRWNPSIPAWVEYIILKAVASSPADRFETVDEFYVTLERGETFPIMMPRKTPLIAKNPLLFWKVISLILLILNFILLYGLTRW